MAAPAVRSERARAALFALGVAVSAAGVVVPDEPFSAHVLGHLLLAVAGPLLCTLGSPEQHLRGLAGARAVHGLRRALRRPLPAALVSPAGTLVLFNGGMWALYTTPLYRASLDHVWLHALVHVHFLLSGLLFAQYVTGAPTLGRRASYPTRLGVLGLTLPSHALLGLVVLASDPSVYETTRTGASAAADVRLAAAELWIVGDLLVSAVIVVLVVSWAADEERRERARVRLAVSSRRA